MNSKTNIGLLFVMVSLGGMIAIPGLSIAQQQPAYAQTILTPEGLLPDFFDDEEDEENGDDNGDDGGDAQGDDNQNLEQTNNQEQNANQEVVQLNDQSEENEQENEMETGDNTATVTQANDADQAVEAEESGDVEEEAEAEGSTSSDADSIADADATATGLIDQDNNADVNQDSSADDNILVNENEFGDDTNIQVAVPISDQDQTAENRAANIAIELDPTVDNVEEVNEEEEQIPPEEQQGVFCLTSGGPGFATLTGCAPTLEACLNVQAIVEAPGGRELIQGCAPFPEPPEGADCFDPVTGTSNPCP